MDVNVGGFSFSSCSSASASVSATHSSDGDGEDNNNNMGELRRGPWTVEEDLTLINYISNHGEGRWNSLARCAGLKRTGKSCRLRWLNYLRPDVRRGNISLEEQLLILELHSRWGNRWSKIAQHLPGRTDNEIKNYWRTRVQKHAKQLQCDVNSKQFKDTMRYLWMPRLVERIQAAAAATTAAASPSSSSSATHHLHVTNNHQELSTVNQLLPAGRGGHINTCFTPENSSTAASSDSLPSDLRDYYTFQASNNNYQNTQNGHVNYAADCNTNQYSGCFNQGQGLSVQGGEQQQQQQQPHQNMWLGGEDTVENSWNVEDLWFLQQHFYTGN